MLLVFANSADAGSSERLEARLLDLQLVVERRHDESGAAFFALSGVEAALAAKIESWPEVGSCFSTPRPYAMVSRAFKAADTVVEVGPIRFGDGTTAVIAGPCGVESPEVLNSVADAVRRAGAHGLRGGAFKPRTSPYTFQGLGSEGLQLLAQARRRTELPIITEVMTAEDVKEVASVADMLQVGTRNMQNFRLLEAVGRSGRPVLLKRGMMATLEEFLAAAEYVRLNGNENIVLCERGIRTFETAMRNTLDLAAVAWLKRETHLPVLVDPSHGCGLAELVPDLSKAALAVGADGLLIEVHAAPERALSDGQQSLNPAAFSVLMAELGDLARALGRPLAEVSSSELRAPAP